ncbi:TerB family tellurite resistance protein [Dyadobacter frigoris]|uniref:TerB family tellurite resistance protein n=1 Tax=Dyadobacter frigoris TaxID=2576211 RepID=A0A4U6CX76_9BACT|nr:TerB family tellurite resistance protein [Dyadobacter frigoris]TKT86014.1 TerB family tellurite resistance protein [Dyadobacter frigoris]
MKISLTLLLLAFLLVPVTRAEAQTAEVTQLILNIEKLNQLRKILKELKAGYEILFKGYNTIRDLSRGNFKLHEAFLDGLLQVSPAVKKYSRVQDIIQCQLALVKEYRTAYQKLSSTDNFTQDELAYMEDVYTDLIQGSVKNLDALTTVLTAKKLRASDDERLRLIDSIYEDMTDKLTFLRHFNSNSAVLGAQRASEKADIELRKKMYDIEP